MIFTFVDYNIMLVTWNFISNEFSEILIFQLDCPTHFPCVLRAKVNEAPAAGSAAKEAQRQNDQFMGEVSNA